MLIDENFVPDRARLIHKLSGQSLTKTYLFLNYIFTYDGTIPKLAIWFAWLIVKGKSSNTIFLPIQSENWSLKVTILTAISSLIVLP